MSLAQFILGDDMTAKNCIDNEGRYRLKILGTQHCLYEKRRCRFQNKKKSVTNRIGDVEITYFGCDYNIG